MKTLTAIRTTEAVETAITVLASGFIAGSAVIALYALV